MRKSNGKTAWSVTLQVQWPGVRPRHIFASSAVCFIAILFVTNVFSQEQVYSPAAPISPTTMAECSKLQGDYGRYQQKITEQHQACLDAHRKQSSPPAKSEPAGVCSVPACQSLHSRMYSAGSAGAAAVSECRQKVQKGLDDQAKKKKEQEAAQKHAKEDQAQDEDNRRRKAYSDEQERLRASQEARLGNKLRPMLLGGLSRNNCYKPKSNSGTMQPQRPGKNNKSAIAD